jgi:hypothetical protein
MVETVDGCGAAAVVERRARRCPFRASKPAVPWLIEFKRIGGADYITTETAEAPLEFDDNTTLPNVTFSFEDLKLLSAMPEYGSVGANDSSDALAEP